MNQFRILFGSFKLDNCDLSLNLSAVKQKMSCVWALNLNTDATRLTIIFGLPQTNRTFLSRIINQYNSSVLQQQRVGFCNVNKGLPVTISGNLRNPIIAAGHSARSGLFYLSHSFRPKITEA
jgi:hypothetical protein